MQGFGKELFIRVGAFCCAISTGHRWGFLFIVVGSG